MWNFPDVMKFRVAALIRYRRKQCGSDIRTITRIGLKSNQLSMSRHLSTRNISCKSMLVFFSNLANRQTNTGKKHVPAPLSEVIARSVAAGFGRHGMLPPACNNTGIAFCFPNIEEAEMRRTYEQDDPQTRTPSRRSSMISSCNAVFAVSRRYITDISMKIRNAQQVFLLTTASIVSVNVFRNKFPALSDNFRLYLKQA